MGGNSMGIKYSLDAKERIRNTDYTSFSDLMQCIPKDKTNTILKQLPKLNGFRAGKDTEIRLKRYFNRSQSWDEKDWTLLLGIWLTYTESQSELKSIIGFKNKRELEKLVEELLTSEEQREEIAERIIQDAYTKGITQKALRTWLRFSPLPQDAKVERLLALVPEESSTELKARITSVEGMLKSIKNELVESNHLQSVNKSINKIGVELASHSRQLERTAEELEQAFNSITQLENTRDSLIGNFDAHSKVHKSLQASATATSSQIKAIQKEIEAIQKEIEAIRDEIVIIREKQAVDVELLKEDHVQLGANMEVLMQEVEALKDLKLPSTGGVDSRIEKQLNEELKILTRTYLKEDEEVHLQSIHDAATHLEKNLNSLGIKLSHARRLSKEVMAALISGQIVSLQGPLAYLVAERCASCLAGGELRVIKIPFGFVGSLSMDTSMAKLIEEHESSNYPTAVIIEGINRTAFEAYGDSIRQFVIERIFKLRPNSNSLLIFATVIDGPTMIPAGSELLELGPLISLDSIKWMDKASSKGIIGLVSKEVFDGNSSPSFDDYEWEESIIPNWLYSLGGPLWRKSLILADAHGRKINSSIEEPFEFAAFGWIVPMAIYLNSRRLTDFTELAERDDRLKALLAKYEQEVVGSNEMEVYR